MKSADFCQLLCQLYFRGKLLFLINLSCCYGLEAVLFPLLRFQDQEALKFLHLKKIPRVHIIHPYK